LEWGSDFFFAMLAAWFFGGLLWAASFAFFCLRGAFGCLLMVLAFPCFLIGLLASPLCGAAQ
jgi:hypothetical protein